MCLALDQAFDQGRQDLQDLHDLQGTGRTTYWRPEKKMFLSFGPWTLDFVIFDLKIGFLVNSRIYCHLEISRI